jgi:hypothetical protein
VPSAEMFPRTAALNALSAGYLRAHECSPRILKLTLDSAHRLLLNT